MKPYRATARLANSSGRGCLTVRAIVVASNPIAAKAMLEAQYRHCKVVGVPTEI